MSLKNLYNMTSIFIHKIGTYIDVLVNNHSLGQSNIVRSSFLFANQVCRRHEMFKCSCYVGKIFTIIFSQRIFIVETFKNFRLKSE